MNYVIRKMLVGVMIALLMLAMISPVVMAEDASGSDAAPQTEQKAEATVKPDKTAEAQEQEPAPAQDQEEEKATAVPEATEEPEATAAPEATEEPEATAEPEVTVAPEATEEPEATAAPEATEEPEETAEPEIVEIQDEQVPLAGGAEPTVTIRANCDLGALHIGDKLVLTAELNGFEGMDCSIRWQARIDGKWKDLKGETSSKLTIEITQDNADWSYRAAVDVQPV